MKRKPIELKTRGARIKAHRKMWRWLAENPQKQKDEWPGWIWNGGGYAEEAAHCFLCHYPCRECPLIWLDLRTLCITSFHRRWTMCESSEERSRLAKQIAELPVRPLSKKRRK